MSVALPAFLAALAAGAGWFLLPLAARRLGERRLAARCREARAILLSYDDGPGATLTPALLDLLARHGVRATFFVRGDHAEARPALVRRALAEGHAVGHHSHAHSHAWKSLPHRHAADIARGRATVAALGGNPHLHRPTYGKQTLASWLASLRSPVPPCWWTIDPQDSWRPRPVAEVLAGIDRAGGGVVLLHDFEDYPRLAAADRAGHPAHVLALTEAIIAHARARGFRLLSFADLAAAPTAASARPAAAPATRPA